MQTPSHKSPLPAQQLTLGEGERVRRLLKLVQAALKGGSTKQLERGIGRLDGLAHARPLVVGRQG